MVIVQQSTSGSGERQRRARVACGRALAASDRELEQVSTNLQHGLGRELAAAKLALEIGIRRVQDGATLEACSLLQNAVPRLRAVIVDLRRIAEQLQPAGLRELGVGPALAVCCRRFSRTHREVALTLDISVGAGLAVPPHVKSAVFHIARQALERIAVHSHSRSAAVSLQANGKWLSLRITDPGGTPNVEAPAPGDRRRVDGRAHGMRCRAEASGGNCSVRLMPGRGLVIDAWWRLPMQACGVVPPERASPADDEPARAGHRGRPGRSKQGQRRMVRLRLVSST